MALLIHENFNLMSFNSFGVGGTARYFTSISSIPDLMELMQKKRKTDPAFSKINMLCLGEGSNILLIDSFSGLILKNEIKGIEVLKETDQSVHLKVGAGENWHGLVLHCVNQGWGGIENLSLIPGTVGAAPIQNIGAYGVEVKEVIDEVEFYDMTSDQIRIFKKEECQFSYRDSLFKQQGKGKWIITHVYFTLSKNPIIKAEYGALQAELQKRKITNPRIKDISSIVMDIRRSKLPDPKQLGNAGSFFKNPIVPAEVYTRLKTLYPQLVSYPESPERFKLAAGWLIEQCGLKGLRQGACGIHAQQALVLVNYGGATGKEILALSELVKTKVLEKFQVLLETEVQIIF